MMIMHVQIIIIHYSTRFLAKLYRAVGNTSLAISTLDLVCNDQATSDAYKMISLLEKATLYFNTDDPHTAFQLIDDFEKNDGFNILKKNKTCDTSNLRKFVILLKLTQCYNTSNVSKLVHYLSICTSNELVYMLKQLKHINQVVESAW